MFKMEKHENIHCIVMAIHMSESKGELEGFGLGI
jgi:hypothetical protein